MERHYREKTHQLKLIADSVPVHLNYLDQQERFVFMNKAALEFWNRGPEQILGKSMCELLDVDTYETIRPCIEKVLKGETVTHEAEFKTADGSVGYFLNSYIPDVDPEGKVLGFVASGTDVTERKKIHDEVKKLAREFQTLADTMPQIVWTANPDGHVDFYNKRWYEYTGLPEGSADNKLWDSILYPEDGPILHSTWTHALETGTPYEVEFRLKHAKTGEYRWLLSRARPVRDAKGNIKKWYGSNTDIHDQKMILTNLRTEVRLREQFIYTLTHDLRTPLTVAKMSSQLMLKKGLDPSMQKLAFKIEENMARADRMIQDLLDASRVKAGQKLQVTKGECDLVGLIEQVVEEASLVHGDRFHYHGPSTLLGNWDCEGVRRVVENLVSNAVKYGDPIQKIHLGAGAASDWALIEVVNYGNPIEEEELPYLFDPYTRISPESHIQGWGLGLSLVKGITEAHGGNVSVSSSERAGTKFIVTLPLGKEP